MPPKNENVSRVLRLRTTIAIQINTSPIIPIILYMFIKLFLVIFIQIPLEDEGGGF